MKIIVRKSDGVVLYAVDSVLRVTDEMIVCDALIISDIGGRDADIYDAKPPENFVGGAFKYVDETWAENSGYVAPTPATKTAADIQIEIVQSTQRRLDDFAKTRNYDGIFSLCTYATSSVPKFASEGQRGVDIRDQTWATLYTIMGEVQAGARPLPSGYADIEPSLPELTWPDEQGGV